MKVFRIAHTFMVYYFFIVSCFLLEILRILDTGRKKKFRDFLLLVFKKLTETPPLNCKIHRETFQGILQRFSHHDWAVKKILFSRTSKTPVSSFCKYIFLKKINIGRKNTSRQCLIPFRKIQLCKLSLPKERKLL